MNTYQRIAGRFTFLTGNARLWLGDDHLLLVTSLGLSEEYKRFYYADIQAVHVIKTSRYLVNNIVAGGLTALLLIPALEFSGIAQQVFLGLALVALAALVTNLFLGATCACYLRTAVQTCRLPPVNRTRRAGPFLDALRPRIAAVQSPVPHEQLIAEATGAVYTASTPVATDPELGAP